MIRWPNQKVPVTKGTIVFVVLLWLNWITEEPAFAGLAILMLVIQLACLIADTVDNRTVDE
jgi:uncharacterized protein (DUF983 family)